MAQILVTGSSGYIGQNVISEPAGADFKVFAMTRKLISDDVVKQHKKLNFFIKILSVNSIYLARLHKAAMFYIWLRITFLITSRQFQGLWTVDPVIVSKQIKVWKSSLTPYGVGKVFNILLPKK